jgi:hypothetical protein
MYLNSDITFIYVVAGNNTHYENLKTSINSVRSIYQDSNILIGDFDNKFDSKYSNNIEVIDLSNVSIDRKKTFKHIIWQYKYHVSQLTKSKYNLYLDTDTVLVNKIDNLINESNGRFTIAKHFWVENVEKFKSVVERQNETYYFIESLGLKDHMDFCAAGVFFFEKNKINLNILKETFDIHESIYKNREYILGIYDETILNSVLQKYINNVIYYNGSLNHCSMIDMPLIYKENTLFGKNIFDNDFKPVTCLHCDKFIRDPSSQYKEPIKSLIKKLFEI